MAKCGTVVCMDDAICVVFWPGQTTVMCEACMLRASAIANHMGFELAIELLPPVVVVVERTDNGNAN